MITSPFLINILIYIKCTIICGDIHKNFGLHGTKIKYTQKGPTLGTKIIIHVAFKYHVYPNFTFQSEKLKYIT